ncbi:hypothetical protein ESZ39_09830 [Colwellia sp. C1TZA3]|nr:hypothetical protein ESZ39_09830 [Colwellia sp. C1TZA3]
MLLSLPIASYCSIERLTLNYFSCAQQDHKLNGTGINLLFKRCSFVTVDRFAKIQKLSSGLWLYNKITQRERAL